ncbi:MAG: prepilin-type N-terminal cleavage/methylation domain-containing protein [Frankiaceae bacterium]|nr:prepilin-type N-terminal cleavage/methylation domain-containing protein [Frankiaceae bacterium]MBV9368413.1 prepilin-type N-terminal cleavage/methylation domain-containing protein [Frankiales bacterium]
MLTARLSRSVKSDEGVTLVEVVISLMVFGIIASAVGSMLIGSLITSRTDRNRVAAAGLAARELDITRDAFSSNALGPRSVVEGQVVNPDPLPGGAAGQAIVVNNVPFTITRTAEWTNQVAAGPCDNGNSGQLAYLRVTVNVTWPNATKPVTTTTLLTPRLGTYKNGEGNIKVKVVDANGAPQSGIVVSAGGTTISTATDGCAFFAFLDPGTYTVSVNTTGYVDQQWNQLSSQQVTVQGNQVSNVTFAYSRSATLNLTWATLGGLTGYSAPSAMTVTAGNTAIQPSGTLDLTGRGVSGVYNAWPYTTGVSVWAGNCADADPQGGFGAAPQTPYYSGATRTAPVATVSGQSQSASVIAVPVRVNVTSASNAAVTGLTVIAVHAADPAGTPCASGETLTAPVTTASGGITQVLLPYGKWTLQVSGKTLQSGKTWPVVTLDPRVAVGSLPYVATVPLS